MAQPIAEGSVFVPAEDIAAWAVQCLQALDLRPPDARQLADSLVQTSLWGVDTHGIARLPHYFDRLSRRSIRAQPALKVNRTGPSTAQVDGDHGQGILVAHFANRLAMDMARETGIAAVGVHDSSHCGAVGLYAREAARAGLIGLAFTHADSIAAPHGGQRPFFGTNPIAIAFPREGGEPVCLDMATTSIPWNRVMNARREGHTLPPDIAIDAQGQPTTDPNAAIAVTPLGGHDYGHKGYALALMVDLLSGPLHGNPFGPNIPAMFGNLDVPRHIGAFFIVLDPMRFAGGRMLAAVVEQMAHALAAEPGSPRMPGDPEHDCAAERRITGLPVEPQLARQMHDWSERLGVASPLRTIAQG